MITQGKPIAQLFSEAESLFANGYSRSRLVEFVFNNANNDAQAEYILDEIFNEAL